MDRSPEPEREGLGADTVRPLDVLVIETSLALGAGSPHTECCVSFKDLTHTNTPFHPLGVWPLG